MAGVTFTSVNVPLLFNYIYADVDITCVAIRMMHFQQWIFFIRQFCPKETICSLQRHTLAGRMVKKLEC